MANICVVGLWHQASVVSACLADMGHQVRGVGDDEKVVGRLNSGDPPVHEPKLRAIMRRNLRAGRLKYMSDYSQALAGAGFAYIAIDTPVGRDDESDLTSIFEAGRRIGSAASSELILIVSAQVPVGTCERIAAVAQEGNRAAGLRVAYVPEFLRLGTAVDTFVHADRFVVGADDAYAAQRIADLYRPLGREIVLTNLRTAEMSKHACNAFLATSISFINEIAGLCDELDADALQVAEIMKLDRRIGPYAFLSPGLGFAGGTLGREIRALQALGHRYRCDTSVVDAAMAVNQARPGLVGRRLRKVYDSLEGLQVGILGLTYKAGTSTLRRSVALDIIQDLVAQGVSVKAFDPLARLDETGELPPFEVSPNPYAAAEGSDALVLVTEWADARELDLHRLRAAMRRPVFVDTRNVFDPESMTQHGFIYSGIGRGLSSERSTS